MPISNANVEQVGVIIKADGVIETTNGIKLTNQQIRELGKGLLEAANEGKVFSAAQERASKDTDAFVRKLREEAQTLGLTAVQLRAFQADQLALTDAQRQNVTESLRQIQAYEQQQERIARLSSVASAAGKVIGLAAAAVGAAFIYQTKKAIDAAAGMDTLSEKTGVTVEKLSQLRYAADVSETSIESLAKAMRQLPKSLVEAQNPRTEAGRAFDFLRIDPRTIKSQEQGFDAIADAIQRVEDPLARAAALQMIFKRNGEELIPFFAKGAAGIRSMSEAGAKWAEISGINATEAKRLKDQTVSMGYAVDEIAKSFAKDLVPRLNDAAEAFLKNAAEGNKFLGVLAAIKAFFLGNELQRAQQDLFEKTDEWLKREKDYGAAMAALGNNDPNAAYFGSNRAAQRAKTLRDKALADAQAAQTEVRRLEQAMKPAAAPQPTGGTITGMPKGTGTSAAENLADRLREATEKFKAEAARAADDIEDSPEVRRYFEAIQRVTTGDYRKAPVSLQQQYAQAATDRFQAEVKARQDKQVRETGYAGSPDFMKLLREQNADFQWAGQQTAQQLEKEKALREKYAHETAQINARMIRDDSARAWAIFEEEKRVKLREIELFRSGTEERQKQEELYATWVVARHAQITEQLKPEWQRMLDDYSDVTRQMKEAHDRFVVNGLRAGENAFVKWASTGKLSIRDLFGTLREEIARSYYQQNLAKPIAGGLASLGSLIFGGGSGAGGGGGGSAGAGDIFGVTTTGTAHSGGVLGSNALATRSVPAALFAGARRYHYGGLIAPDEVPIIGRRGEEVLRADDPRHRNNQGAGQSLRVEIVNKGAPKEVTEAQPRFDAQGMVVRLLLDDQGRDGPITKGFANTFGLRR